MKRSRLLAIVLPLTVGAAALGVAMLADVPAQRAFAQALRERGVKTQATVFKVTSSRSRGEGTSYWSEVEYRAGGRRYESAGPMKSADGPGHVPGYGEKVWCGC